jgi:hypothetical protein
MRLALALALLLAGCGEPPMASDNEGASANQIARLSTPKEVRVDPQASVRLEPLGLAELDAAGMPLPACDFASGGRTLFAASSADAIARIEGRLFHFTHSSPIGPTGGFFEDRQISISVGRVGETPLAGADEWPARLIVTNRRTGAQAQRSGVWRCAG